MEHSFTPLLVNIMKVNGTLIREVGGGGCIILTALYTRGSGLKTRETGKDY